MGKEIRWFCNLCGASRPDLRDLVGLHWTRNDEDSKPIPSMTPGEAHKHICGSCIQGVGEIYSAQKLAGKAS